MDVLVARATRVLQIAGDVAADGNALAPFALAGVLASLLLAPIVPPGAATIFGVKGARTPRRRGLEELRRPSRPGHIR